LLVERNQPRVGVEDDDALSDGLDNFIHQR